MPRRLLVAAVAAGLAIVMSAGTATAATPVRSASPPDEDCFNSTYPEYGIFWMGLTPGGIAVPGAAIWVTLSYRQLYCVDVNGRNAMGSTARILTSQCGNGLWNYFEAGWGEYLDGTGQTSVRAFTEVGSCGSGSAQMWAFPCPISWGSAYHAIVTNVAGTNDWQGLIDCPDYSRHPIGPPAAMDAASGIPDSEVFRRPSNEDIESYTGFQYQNQPGVDSWSPVAGVQCRRDTDYLFGGQATSASGWNVISDTTPSDQC
jgi:hypothetical protein